MPVVLNINICRPKEYTGKLVFFNINKPGLFSQCVLWNIENPAGIITSTRDYDVANELSN
jgi:hypothetical protein